MGARGARRGGRQRQHTQTGTQDALVQYYDWAGCAVRRTWLRMGAGTREEPGTLTQGAPVSSRLGTQTHGWWKKISIRPREVLRPTVFLRLQESKRHSPSVVDTKRFTFVNKRKLSRNTTQSTNKRNLLTKQRTKQIEVETKQIRKFTPNSL